MGAPKVKPRAIGCSIYGGLFTVGVKRAGFQVLAHLEQDAYGVATAKLNHPELEFHVGKDAWPKKIDNLDLVFCNPPCAVWSGVGRGSIGSTSGALADWREDPRLQHAHDALELVDRYRPTIWIWESVPNALTKGRETILKMAREGSRLGYATTVVLFDAVNLGVPQRRPRVFVVLHKVEFEPIISRWMDYDRAITVKEAWAEDAEHIASFKEHEKTRPQDLKLLPHVPAGTALRKTFDSHFGEDGGRNDRGQVIGRPSIPERRLAFDRPGIPMFAKAWHPKLHRRITVGEALALAQMPASWKFDEKTRTPTARKELLQRAVMPRVGQWIAQSARDAIVRGVKVDKVRVNGPLLYDLRTRDHVIKNLDANVHVVASSGDPNVERIKVTKKAVTVTFKKEPRVRDPAAAANELKRAQSACKNLESGSGGLIRKRILEGRLDDDAIVAEVMSKFEGRKTTRSDVAWNRRMLRLGGLLKEKNDEKPTEPVSGTVVSRPVGQRHGAPVPPEVRPAGVAQAAAPRARPAKVPDRKAARGAQGVRGRGGKGRPGGRGGRAR